MSVGLTSLVKPDLHQHGVFVKVPRAGVFVKVPKAGVFVKVPKAGVFVKVPKAGVFVKVPKAGVLNDKVPCENSQGRVSKFPRLGFS